MTHAPDQRSGIRQNSVGAVGIRQNSATRDGILANSATSRDERLKELLALHFHPRHGSRYWLRRQEEQGWPVCGRVRCHEDLWLLGPTPLEDLRRFPVRDFIPRTFHDQLSRFVLG